MIRKITAADADFIYSLYMHPEVNPWLLYEMMDEKSFRSIFDDLLARNIIYIFSAAGNDVGMFKLIREEHRNAHQAYLGGVAVHPAFAGKGYGRQMMEEAIALGKTWRLKRIELSTASINGAAIALYKKMGFEQEGVLRKFTYLKAENKFLDEIMMSYLYE